MTKLLFLIPIVLLGGLVVLSVISQRGTAPGVVDGRLLPGSAKPNAVSSEAGTPGAQVVEPFTATRDQLRAAIAATGGTIVTDTDDYIAATYSTGLMRYVDDVEFRRDDTVWQVRSASHVGHSDMGTNRKRVERIRAAVVS